MYNVKSIKLEIILEIVLVNYSNENAFLECKKELEPNPKQQNAVLKNIIRHTKIDT